MAAVKAQTSVEFITILTVILTIVITLVGINYDIFRTHEGQMRMIRAKDTVNEIHKASEAVYKEGKGAKTKIFVNLPGGINSTKIGDNVILLNMSSDSDVYQVLRKVSFNISGDIPSDDGYYWVNVSHKDSGVVVGG